MNRILVVDGDESIRILYSDELMEEGYEVTGTGDASQALAAIGETGPGLVLLEIRSDPSKGLDILQDIRKTHHALPVILCGTYSSFKYDLKSLAPVDYVVKSSKLTELKLKIKAAFEGAERVAPHSLQRLDGRKAISIRQMKTPS